MTESVIGLVCCDCQGDGMVMHEYAFFDGQKRWLHASRHKVRNIYPLSAPSFSSLSCVLRMSPSELL